MTTRTESTQTENKSCKNCHWAGGGEYPACNFCRNEANWKASLTTPSPTPEQE